MELNTPEKRIVIEFAKQYLTWEFDKVRHFLHPEFVYKLTPTLIYLNPDYKYDYRPIDHLPNTMRGHSKSFKVDEFEPVLLIQEGNKLILHSYAKFKPLGPYPVVGIHTTNYQYFRPFSFSIFKLKDGKIICWENFLDLLEVVIKAGIRLNMEDRHVKSYFEYLRTQGIIDHGTE